MNSAKRSERLVWVDLEMSGLDPERDRILEVAVLVTDAALNVVAKGPDLAINQPESVLEAMDAWNTRHHGESGLTERVRNSDVSEQAAEASVLRFVSEHCEEKKSPLAGNSIHQDRAFIRRYWPNLDNFLHYRNVDVSTLKELVKRWYPAVASQAPKKTKSHRALDDIEESIIELKYYRQTVFVDPIVQAR